MHCDNVCNEITFITMDKEIRNKLPYIICVIRNFADKTELSTKQAYNYLKRYQGISFLDECYPAEHTLSIENAVDDLLVICKRNGGKLS